MKIHYIFPTNYLSDCVFRTFIKASFGTSILPTFLSFFFPSACLFKSFIFRVISPPYWKIFLKIRSPTDHSIENHTITYRHQHNYHHLTVITHEIHICKVTFLIPFIDLTSSQRMRKVLFIFWMVMKLTIETQNYVMHIKEELLILLPIQVLKFWII